MLDVLRVSCFCHSQYLQKGHHHHHGVTSSHGPEPNLRSQHPRQTAPPQLESCVPALVSTLVLVGLGKVKLGFSLTMGLESV